MTSLDNLELPSPVKPYGAYAEAVQSGNLLFLTGMLPVLDQKPKYRGRIGAELNDEDGYEAARLAALNDLAVAKEHLGSLERIKRVVRLGVMLATSGDLVNQPKVADGASGLLRDESGNRRRRERNPGVLLERHADTSRKLPRLAGSDRARRRGIRYNKRSKTLKTVSHCRVLLPTGRSVRIC